MSQSAHLSSGGAGLVAPEDEMITCESLDILVRGAHQLLQTFEVIAHDLALISSGKRLVFALDFSELYTFLWPEKSRSHTPQVTRTLLESRGIDFTLPPGSTVELIHQLRRLASVSETDRRHIENFTAQPMVSAFLKLFEGSDEKMPIMRVVQEVPKLQSALRGVASLTKVLNRLTYLDRMPNLLPFNTFFDKRDEPLEPDPEVLRQCLLSLNLRRPGKGVLNNHIDAHNYSLMWALSNRHFSRKNTVYLLVTSSPIPYYIFRQHIWGSFPDKLPDHRLPKLSLVRHPIHVTYLARVHSLGPAGEQALAAAKQELSDIIAEWQRVPEYRQFVERKVPPTTRASLPTGAGYLEKYVHFRHRYDKMFRPVREAVESDLIAEENIRQMREVSLFGVGAHVLGDLEDGSPISSTRLIFELFDRLTRLTASTIKKFRRSLKGLPQDLLADVDTEGVVVKRQQLDVSASENSEFSCIEISAMRRMSGELYFSGDVYDDYYAVWWTTGVTFAEFLEEVRRFIASAREQESVPHSPEEKEYDGIYLYQEGKVEPLHWPLSQFPELDLHELLEQTRARATQMTHMIRIAFERADLCYDFASYRGLPQRAGIVSHMRLVEPLSWLIRRTNARRVSFPETRRALEECFNLADKFKEARDVRG